MKTKIIVGISIVVALFVGFIIGSAHSADSWIRLNNQNVDRNYASDASTYMMALNFLRNDNQQGCVNVLENSLESSLFALNHDYKTLAEQPDDAIYRTIKDARVYRSKYP